MNPLEKAVASGVRVNEKIGRLFGRVGTESSPRGFVQTAYRNGLRAVKSALGEERRLLAVNEALAGLRDAISSGTQSILVDAQSEGISEASQQLRYYGIRTDDEISYDIDLLDKQDAALGAVLAKVDAQIAAVQGLVITNADESQIVGDDERKGILQPADIASTVAFWTTAILWDTFGWWVDIFSGELEFQKQAVAAIDSRTTDCCLRVHGQVQPLNKPFHLTGTPRYADHIDWPGFHWWCRTSGVLYLKGFDNGLTAQMRAEAGIFLKP